MKFHKFLWILIWSILIGAIGFSVVGLPVNGVLNGFESGTYLLGNLSESELQSLSKSISSKLAEKRSVKSKCNHLKTHVGSNQNNQSKAAASNSICDNCKAKISKIGSELKNLQEAKRKILYLHNGGLRLVWNQKHYRVFIANTAVHKIETHFRKKGTKPFYGIADVRTYLQSRGEIPLMITNGGMYRPDFKPVGLFRELDGAMQYPLDTSTRKANDNFHLYPNGVFYVDAAGKGGVVQTRRFFSDTIIRKAPVATQSGPMLVVDGQIHSSFSATSSNNKIRSGVGAYRSEILVFIASVESVSFYEISEFFLEFFECPNALFLDGQVSLMDIQGMEQPPSRRFGPMVSVTQKSK